MANEHVLAQLWATIESRKAEAGPERSYTRELLQAPSKARKKVAEEAAEAVLAAKGGDKLHIVRETADLWFHSLLLLAWHGLAPEDVLAELRRREGVSGLAEKQSRGK